MILKQRYNLLQGHLWYSVLVVSFIATSRTSAIPAARVINNGGDGNIVVEITRNAGNDGTNNGTVSKESDVTYNTTKTDGYTVTVITVTNSTSEDEGNNETNNTTGTEGNQMNKSTSKNKVNTLTDNSTEGVNLGLNNTTSRNKLDTLSGSITSSEGHHVCLTKGCVNAASEILERMDSNANPCDDFERFACGSYQDHIMTDNGDYERSRTSIEITKIVKNLITENITEEDSEGMKFVKSIYSSCMDKDSIEERGLAPLQNVLAQLGGWPVVEGDTWNDTTYKWTESIYKIREFGYSTNILFYLGTSSDDKNSSWNILQVFQPSTFMQRKFLLEGFNHSNIQAYYEYQLGMATLLGADKKRAETEIKEAIEFEAEIAKISLPPEDYRNYTGRYTKMTMNDLEKMVPDIPWLEYVNEMLSPYFTVKSSEPIVVYATDFLKKMTPLINKTPKRTLANYIIWNIVRRSTSLLNRDVDDLKFKYEKKVDGKEDQTSRRWLCTSYVKSEFAISAYYINKYFKDEARNITKEMVRYIHGAFNDKLRNLEWLDETTRKMALQKSEAIWYNVAYPDELLDDSKLDEYYAGLNVTKGNFFEERLNWSKQVKLRKLKKFRTKVDKRNWEKYGTATTVNAYYYRSSNAISIPAGILRQGVYFNEERPMYLNYGAIGSVIGHEISHGFDDNGRKYDVKGDVNNWWESETESKYKEKSQCIIEQYGNFTVPQIEENVNGKLTAGENIADNGGLKDAYNGYKKFIKENGEEPLLPGLPYTQSQLFWLSAANYRCSKPRPESLKKSISTGVHSPDRFRINGPVMNSVDFSNDFNCPVGSPMNPKDKCEVW